MCQSANPFKVGSAAQASYFKPKPQKKIPNPKKELLHQSMARKSNGGFGNVIMQVDRISKDQVLNTYAIYLLNKDKKTSSWPLYVFGENDIDKSRMKGMERDMIGGLAGLLGDYDSNISFGITTTFYKNKFVNHDFSAFKKIIDEEFEILLNDYICNGHDIIVPSPNLQDLHGFYEKSYWKVANNEKKQVIFHNIGTGLANIPLHYIEYIQFKFDCLKTVGKNKNKNSFYANAPPKADPKDIKNEKPNEAKLANDKNDGNDPSNAKNENNAANNGNDANSASNRSSNNNNNNTGQGNKSQIADEDAALAKAIAMSMMN